MRNGLLSRFGLVLRAHDAISRFGYWVGSAALGAIVVIYAYEVMMRYFFNAPTRWGSDFVAFLLLISLFTIIPWLSREAGHISVTLLPEMLPKKIGRWVVRLGFLVSAGVCFWAGYIAYLENVYLYDRGTMTLTTIRFPKWIFMVLITYGLLNSGLYFIRAVISPPKTQGSLFAEDVGEGGSDRV